MKQSPRSRPIRNVKRGSPWGLIVLVTVLFAGIGTYRLSVHRQATQDGMCATCNVVILDIDMLRADALRCFGEGRDVTPNICALIRQSAYFTKDFSQSYWTLPSELSTFTSTYPNTHGVWAMTHGQLPGKLSTLADQFLQSGYHTYYVGGSGDSVLSVRNGGLSGYEELNLEAPDSDQWLSMLKHAENSPQPYYFHAYDASLHMPYFLDESEDPPNEVPKPKGLPLYKNEFDRIWAQYLAAHYKEVFAPQTILDHPEVFLADMSVRQQRMVDYFNTLEKQHDYTKRQGSWQAYFNSYIQFIDMKNQSDLSYLRGLYETKLHTLDRSMAPLITYLLQPSVSSNTIVVLTSAHGESFGLHGALGHVSQPYNELYNVPLVIKYPGVVARRIDAVVENIDLYPTILALVNGKAPEHIQGVSLVPLLKGESDQAKSYSVSVNDNDTFVIQTNKYAVVVYKDQYKPTEVYDLQKDPMELHSVTAERKEIMNNYIQLLVSNVAPGLLMNDASRQIPVWTDVKHLIRNGYF
jgi:arylsulfatase A-like enzyme